MMDKHKIKSAFLNFAINIRCHTIVHH